MDLVLSDKEVMELSCALQQHVEDCDSSPAAKRMVDNLFKKITDARLSPKAEYSIAIRWYISDVQDTRPDLSKKKCIDVLDYLDRNHDANQGINWEVIKIVADTLFPH